MFAFMKQKFAKLSSWLLAAVLLPMISGCGSAKKAVDAANAYAEEEVLKQAAPDETKTEEPGAAKPATGVELVPTKAPDTQMRVMYGVPPSAYRKL